MLQVVCDKKCMYGHLQVTHRKFCDRPVLRAGVVERCGQELKEVHV